MIIRFSFFEQDLKSVSLQNSFDSENRENMRIVLDTNAFYAYYGEEKIGLQKNNKIKTGFIKILNTENEVCISGATVCECLVRFRNENVEKILEVLSFIANNNLKIIVCDYFPSMTSFNIVKLLEYTEDELRNSLNDYMELKVRIEAAFAMHFMGLLLVQYSLSYFDGAGFFKSQSEIPEDIKLRNSIILLSFTHYIKDITKPIQIKLVSMLRKGYNISFEKVESILRDEFNALLFENMLRWTNFLEVVTTTRPSEINSISIEKIFIKSKKVKKINEKSDHINKLISNLDRNLGHKSSIYLKSIYEFLLGNKNIQQTQVDYMIRLLSKLGGENPKKFEKNDILDMLILTVLNDKDNILITFDEDVQDYLVEIKHKSIQYIEKVYDRALTV